MSNWQVGSVALPHSAGVNPATGLKPLRVLRTNGDWNQYIENPAHQQYFEANFDRIISYNPYGINVGMVNWSVPIWMYFNLHDADNYRLLDSDDQPLYVPWPSAEGPTYPRQTADISNPAYRAAWIAAALDRLAAGFSGFWIDDVNLDVDRSAVRQGGGAPQRDMSWWPQAMADFMDEIRTTLKAQYPNCEILHNSVWFANRPTRWTSAVVQQQIAASDYINIEGGFADGGLNNGVGMDAVVGNDYQQWSLRSMFRYIDTIHGLGKNFIVEHWDDTQAIKDYIMASWLAIGEQGDGIGMHTELDNWPVLDTLWTTDYGTKQSVVDPGTLGSEITVTTTTHNATFTPGNTTSAAINEI